MTKLRKRLTYANVMSSIAVFLVLGGATAFAAKKIGSNEIKSNAITTGKLKKEAVAAAKIKKNAITTAKVKDGAIDGLKVKDGSLTGVDIDASTLGTVPLASKASKTDQIAKIFYAANEGSAKQTILSLGGLTVTAACDPGEDIQLEATTSVNHSLIDSYTPQDQDYEADIDFNAGEIFDADLGHNNGTVTDIYSFSYSQPGGVNVTVEIRDVDPNNGPTFPGTSAQADCFVGGFAVAG